MALSKESIAKLSEDRQEALGRMLLEDLARLHKLRKVARGPLYFITGSIFITALAYLGFWMLQMSYPEARGSGLQSSVIVSLLILIFTHSFVLSRRLDAIMELLKLDRDPAIPEGKNTEPLQDP